ncbi:MAG TPA: hypothetical protein VK457_16265 [Chloroflexota bacterium]|nr:hypothetical protein [Chloroflexota bacterium]
MADGVRVYAGTHEGVLVLSLRNGGCELVSEAFSGAIIDSEASCPRRSERAFVGVTHDGLYRTDDAGTHWRKVLDGDIRSVAVDPTDDRVVYAGTEPVHLYRSEDGGDSWEEIISLQRLPEDTRRKLGDGDGPSILNNQNPGFRHRRQEWTFPLPPHEGHIIQMFIHPDDPNLLYLSIEHGGIARSADRGRTWEDVSEGIDYLDIHTVASLPHRFDRFFVASARGFYTTDDPRNGWTRAENGCSRNYFHDIVFLPTVNGGDATMVMATADGSPGVWQATKGKDEWDSSVTGSRSALFRSGDCAHSWHRVGAGQGLDDEMDPMIWSLCLHPHERNAIFAGVGEVSRGHASGKGGSGSVLLSRDGGDTWQPIKTDIPAVRYVAAAAE